MVLDYLIGYTIAHYLNKQRDLWRSLLFGFIIASTTGITAVLLGNLPINIIQVSIVRLIALFATPYLVIKYGYRFGDAERIYFKGLSWSFLSGLIMLFVTAVLFIQLGQYNAVAAILTII